MKRISFLHIFVALSLISAMGFGYVGYHYVERLDAEIQQTFNGRKWDVPASVYARPLELYPSRKLDADLLEKELLLADYRKENTGRLYSHSATGKKSLS